MVKSTLINGVPEHLVPWYKQFWPWFIISLPATVVVAGLVTVYIAFDNADSLVADDYYKQGLAINGNIKMQTNASTYGYAALLKRMPDNRLFLKFDNATPDTETLSLKWVHPGDSEKDFVMILNRQLDGSFQNKSENDFSGRWYLQLSADSDWLIKSEISSGITTVHLTPRIN